MKKLLHYCSEMSELEMCLQGCHSRRGGGGSRTQLVRPVNANEETLPTSEDTQERMVTLPRTDLAHTFACSRTSVTGKQCKLSFGLYFTIVYYSLIM